MADRTYTTNTSPISSESSLLPGKGHTPNYGISDDSYRPRESDNPQRWHAVALCAFTACIASIFGGMSLSFSSIIINELNDSLYYNPNVIIPSDGLVASLIGATVPLGAILGGLFAWPVADYFGRQAGLIIGGVPALIGWLLISLSVLFSSEYGFFSMILVGRSFTGFASGWNIYCVSVYIAEVASAKRKGLFGNCNQLFITIGIFIVLLLGIKFRGVKISFYIVALVAAGLVTLFELLMLFTYETPRWLFGKNKDYLGIQVLKVLRGPDAQIMREIDRIKAALRRSLSVMEQLKEFQQRSVYLPFILTLVLMFFQQFSGINAAVFYSSTIFNDAGYKGNSAEIASFLAVGVTQIIATLISVVLVDRLGRRILLILSSLGMALSSLILGVYFYLYKSKYNCDPSSTVPHCTNLKYMAISSVVLFIGSFSLGWGPIPWTSMSELLPTKVRGLAASIATVVNWTFASIITFGFSHYSHAVTPKWAWASFSIIMFISIVVIFLFLPETKGRSLEEIQEDFERGRILAVRLSRRRAARGISPSQTSGIN